MIKIPWWMTKPPTTLKGKLELISQKTHLLKSPGAKGKFLRTLYQEVRSQAALLNERAHKIDPLNFFKPSYEQAILLNAWMYGVSFLCIYSANRIGKTTACIVNILLWIMPNNPKWRIFVPYRVGDPTLDQENAHNPRAQLQPDDPNPQNRSHFTGQHYPNPNPKGALVQVFQRPDISSIKLINDALKHRPPHIPEPNPRKPHYDPDNAKVLQWLQSVVPKAYRPTFPDAPWNQGGTIWFGAPDQDHHEQVMFPMWKALIPETFLDRYVPSDREITIKVTSPTGRVTAWELIGKSYESKDTKWSSGAVDAIMLTEGLKPEILKEIKLRFKDPGIGSHDFTPYLPANSGAASALAQRIAKGTEPLPLKHFVFMEFSVYDAPVHIISEDKKQGLIKSYKDDPEGVARLEGKFYSSSMLVLSNLNIPNHTLDLTVEEMFRRFPNGRIYRGLDPGMDHPTCCVWGLLLPSNVWIIYRVLSQRGLSINERCERIISLSNNRAQKVKWGPNPQDFYLVETHPYPNSEIVGATYCDYHTFKADEVTGNPYSLNYITQGLAIIESVHTGPEERALLLNSALKPSNFIPHPITNSPPSPKVFFLKNEPGILNMLIKWEEFYWERIRAGDNKGQPKDKIPDHGDDELDAVCYLVASPLRWTNYRQPARVIGDSEPEHELISASRSSNQSRHREETFATVANQNQLQSRQPQPQQVVYFGNIDEALEDEE